MERPESAALPCTTHTGNHWHFIRIIRKQAAELESSSGPFPCARWGQWKIMSENCIKNEGKPKLEHPFHRNDWGKELLKIPSDFWRYLNQEQQGAEGRSWGEIGTCQQADGKGTAMSLVNIIKPWLHPAYLHICRQTKSLSDSSPFKVPHIEQAKWKELNSQATSGKDQICLFLKNLILKLSVVSSSRYFANVFK